VASDTRELFEAAARGDFAASSSILVDFCSRGLSDAIVNDFMTYQKESARSLRLRDHIFAFLRLDPLYCAIQLSSIDVLKQFSGVDDTEEISYRAFDWSKSLLDSRDPLISLKYLNSESCTGSIYASLLPSIIDGKAEEMELCRIPVSPDGKRFCVKQLDDSSYGHALLLGIGKKTPTTGHVPIFPLTREFFMDRSNWQPVAQALVALGYDPDGMLLEFKEGEWSALVNSLVHEEKVTRNPRPSHEVDMTRRLYDCTYLLNLEYDENRIYELWAFQSSYANELLKSYVRTPQGDIRPIVVEALVESGDTSLLDFLSTLLRQSKGEAKLVLAQGISKMASAKVGFRTEIQSSKVSKHLDAEVTSTIKILGEYSRHKHVAARVEAIRTLAEIDDPRAHNLVRNAIFDDDSRVRREVVALTGKLSREVAASILHIALEDPVEAIRSSAESAVLDQGWDFSNEYSEY